MKPAAALHPHCRIKKVTHKDSGLVIHRLPSAPERTRAAIIREVTGLADGFAADGRNAVGIAVVVWDGDGGSSALLRAYPGSLIPTIALPEFIKNRLLAAKIQEWIGDNA